jgi:hypothetical protein
MGLSSSLPAWSTDWKPRGSRRFASSPLLMKLEMADGRHEDTAQDPKPGASAHLDSASRSTTSSRPWKRETSSINHSKSLAGLRRRPPLACGRAPVECDGPNAKNAKRALPAARRCCKKPLQVGRKPVSAPNQAWKVTFRTGTQKPNSYPYSWTRYGVGSDYWCSDRVENPLWSNALR